jgi:hypothetical protein
MSQCSILLYDITDGATSDIHDAVGMNEWRRPEDELIDDAEDGGGDANRDREHEERQRRRAWLSGEPAN